MEAYRERTARLYRKFMKKSRFYRKFTDTGRMQPGVGQQKTVRGAGPGWETNFLPFWNVFPIVGKLGPGKTFLLVPAQKQAHDKRQKKTLQAVPGSKRAGAVKA
jgi:hypothetical protein